MLNDLANVIGSLITDIRYSHNLIQYFIFFKRFEKEDPGFYKNKGRNYAIFHLKKAIKIGRQYLDGFDSAKDFYPMWNQKPFKQGEEGAAYLENQLKDLECKLTELQPQLV